MVIEQAQTIRTRASTRSALPQALPDRVAQIIAIARLWDLDADLRPSGNLPSPRAGWAHCFAAAAERGFLPAGALVTSD